MRRSFIIVSVLAMTWLSAAVPQGEAGILNITGVGDTNNTARLDFNIAGDILTIDVTNTSLLFNPVVTGFDFNVPSGITGLDSFSVFEGAVNVTANWDATFGLNSQNTPQQFGLFDVETDSDNTPTSIFKGETFRFTFDLAGDTAGLTQNDFITALSFDAAGNPDETEVAALVRFQQTGPNGRDSDVGIPVDGRVPEPGSLLMLGAGLTGLVAWARRRFRADLASGASS